jgi:hypothetical protein
MRFTLSDTLHFRLLMIAAGCEDGNDASTLRSDLLLRMARDSALPFVISAVCMMADLTVSWGDHGLQISEWRGEAI